MNLFAENLFLLLNFEGAEGPKGQLRENSLTWQESCSTQRKIHEINSVYLDGLVRSAILFAQVGSFRGVID